VAFDFAPPALHDLRTGERHSPNPEAPGFIARMNVFAGNDDDFSVVRLGMT